MPATFESIYFHTALARLLHTLLTTLLDSHPTTHYNNDFDPNQKR